MKILELDRNECIDDIAIGYSFVKSLIEQAKEKCSLTGVTTVTTPTTTEKLANEIRATTENSSFWMVCAIVLRTFLLIMIIVVGFLITGNKDMDSILFRLDPNPNPRS